MLHKHKKWPKSVSSRFDSSNLVSQVSPLTKQTQFLSEELPVLTRNSQVEDIPKKVWVRKQNDFSFTSEFFDPGRHDVSTLRYNSS